MTSQLSQYRRLATFTFLLALALYYAPTSHRPGAKTPYGTEWLLRVRSYLNNDTNTMLVEEEEEDNASDKWLLLSQHEGDNLERSNATHALMIDDSRTGRRWMVQKRSIEHYKAEFRDLAHHKYRPKNASSQLDILSALGMGAVLEMEDGREFKCLASFHEVWRDPGWWGTEPFSGEPFLEWLDYGSGRELDMERCDRKRLNRRRYQMLNRTELEASLVEFRIETYLDTANQNSDDDNQNDTTTATTSVRAMVQAVFIATQQPVQSGRWLSVLDLNQNLYLFEGGMFPASDQPFDYWKRGHGSVTGGGPVLFAGEIMIDRLGRVNSIAPDSGHYRPKLQHSKAFYRWIRGTVGDAAQTAIDWWPARSATESERTVWETLFHDDDNV